MNDNESYPLKGRCLCGAVSYQVDKLEAKMAHCHCSMCRKFHGAAFATYGEAKTKHFHWLHGEELLKEYVAENGTTRRFCRICGSSLTFEPLNGGSEYVEFALGTLDTDIQQRPDAHIYVDYKANWSTINDSLPQFKEARDSQLIKDVSEHGEE